jgi:DNA-directed RNA polymerase beta' subunit
MSLYKELTYETDIDTVKGIQFGILSPQEIVDRSVAEVLTTETYQGQTPVIHGLFDPRMGVIDNGAICSTCEQKNSFCPGHFGHIVLAKPVYYVQFLGTVNKILKCVCFRCSHLLIPKDSKEGNVLFQKKTLRNKRFESVYKFFGKLSKKRYCEVCGARQPDRVGKEGMNAFKITMSWSGDGDGPGPSSAASAAAAEEPDAAEEDPDASKPTPPSKGGAAATATAAAAATPGVTTKTLWAEDVLRILQRISDEHADVMGFSPKFARPEWMICTVLPVPPPAVRPSVRNDTGQRMEDDLTHKLSDIVKANDTLKQRLEKGHARESLETNVQFLQYHVATLVDNQIPGMGQSMQRNGRALRSIFDRLKSKEGRIRGNLMGKRVDFSARTVITPDPNISIDEIGVPIKIAMNLTFPEVVNEHNREYLTELVRRGPDAYPGAKYIKKQHPYRTMRLKNADTSQIELELGDVVDRHLINGDYVLFNRQPSLHKMSMMGHKVRVMPYDTFRLNVCATKGYNADFDGDEMNIHIPQSLQTRNELVQLASVPTQIISPKDGTPIVSVVQDVLLGIYEITKSHVQLTEKQVFNLMCPNPTFAGTVPKPHETTPNGIKIWSGRQMLSTILPDNVNYVGNNKEQDERNPNDENMVRIENGVILQGRIDKTVYGAPTKGLVHSIFNEYGADETKLFFDNTQQLVCNWLVSNGFSTGVSDLIVSASAQRELKERIKKMKVDVYAMIKDVHESNFDNGSRHSMHDHFEIMVNSFLNDTIKQMGNLVKESVDDTTNRMINMINSGSKGAPVNLSQMIACLGQQNVDGKRVAYGYDHRTLPHYTKFDDGPESRGFVENSFIEGLSPQEFFFHSMGGREGLIDTAVKSVTGETPIIVVEDNECKYVRIGDWIDAHLKRREDNVQHFTERRMEYLELDAETETYIPTTDEDGRVTWGEVTAVTRHDPGTELYEVKTQGGRSVIVTESKSLLIWHPDTQQFKEVPTPDIKVGDCLPVTAQLMAPPITVSHMEDGTATTYDNGVSIGLSLTEAVPDAAFVAPNDFIRGILSGYFSRDCVTIREDSSIECTCATARLAEGIAMLCSRLGIFAEISGHTRLSIRGQWARKFAMALGFPTPTSGSSTDVSVAAHNDVVLDKIVEINVLDNVLDKYPKVYDLTVPSTLNFGLASGLQVRDTSESGYMQRKLVKAMEDCKVAFDMTVRTANQNIVQFLYGEDGMDAIKIESHPLPYLRMPRDKMENTYLLSSKDDMFLSNMLDGATYKALMATEDWEERCFEHYRQILADRKYFITRIFRGNMADKVKYPVAFSRIMENTAMVYKKFGCMGVLSNLSPMYILEQVEALCDGVQVRASKSTPGIMMFRMLCRMYLSPKVVLKRYGYDRNAFDQVLQSVKARFYDSLVNPSEMVGVVAAQSIGEPLSQLSVVKDTHVQIFAGPGSADGKDYVGGIGAFIDRLLSDNKENLVDLGNDSVVLDLADDAYRVLGVSDDEKTSWRSISQVSRHPANGDLVRVRTRSGRCTTATLSHSFLKRTLAGIVPVRGSMLRVGDRIPIAAFLPAPVRDDGGAALPPNVDLTEELGYEVGANIAASFVAPPDGGPVSPLAGTPASTRDFIRRHFTGRFPSWIFRADLAFLRGLLRGLFPDRGMADMVPAELAMDVMVLYAYFGIFVTKDTHPIEVDGRSYYLVKGYLCDDIPRALDQIPCLTGVYTKLRARLRLDTVLPDMSSRTSISRRRLGEATELFERTAAAREEFAADIRALKQGIYSDVVWDEIVSLEILSDPQEYVYDFTVPGNDSFMVDGGVLVHNTLNTFHSAGMSSASRTVRGMPRINELTRVTKNIKTPSMTLHLKPEFKHNKTRCIEFKNKIEVTLFRDIVTSSKIYFDPEDGTTTIDKDDALIAHYNKYRVDDEDPTCSTELHSPWLLRMEFDRSKMLDMDLTMIDLSFAINSHFNQQAKGVACIFSDDNAGEMIMRIRLIKESPGSVSAANAVNAVNDALTELKALECVVMESIPAKGIRGVHRVETKSDRLERYDNASDAFHNMEEWLMETDGTNLIEAFGLPWVDAGRSYSNDVTEVFRVLGIEAARQALYNEIQLVIEGSANIDYRHLSMLVDVMTMKGSLQPLDRFGINKNSDNGVLAKSSFEEVCDVLTKAGIFSELDKVNSVSANIMLGQISKCGTGDTEILMDPEVMMQFQDDGTQGLSQAQGDDCEIENLKFDFVLPDVDKTIKKKMVE